MDGVLFSSKSDLWETPQELFEKLNQEFRDCDFRKYKMKAHVGKGYKTGEAD